MTESKEGISRDVARIVDNIIFESGETFTVGGYYSYVGHNGIITCNTFVPPQSKKMLFKKGEKAPKLGSCDHDVFWMLLERI